MRLFFALLLSLLTACGASSSNGLGNDPGNPNNPGTNNDACAVTLREDIQLSTTLKNTPAACDYLISPDPSDIGIRSLVVTNGTLTVEPGTVIRFDEGGELRLDAGASLQAVGTAQQRIRFEGAAPVKGYGYGIDISSESLETTIAYADFAYLGRVSPQRRDGGAITGLGGGGLRLSNITVTGSNDYGLDLADLPLLEFSQNTFKDNAKAGVRVTAPQVALLDEASDYDSVVQVKGLFTGDKLQESVIWKPLNAPYLIEDALYVEGIELTLEPGVAILFEQGKSLAVRDGGTLTAIGSEEQPIIFAGLRETPGYWDGISFSSASPDSRLEYSVVAYAGGGSIYEGSVTLAYQERAYIANSSIIGSGQWGICADAGAFLELGPGNTFSENVLGDVNTDCD
jgi:hypothetical protein